ncbi:MAG: hypothetical protein ACLTDR_04720 [Adlercreutzia equolifaciens]
MRNSVKKALRNVVSNRVAHLDLRFDAIGRRDLFPGLVECTVQNRHGGHQLRYIALPAARFERGGVCWLFDAPLARHAPLT